MEYQHLNIFLVIGLMSLPSLLGHQQSPPGVPPQQYAQGPGQPQYQQQQPSHQAQQYQRTAPGVPPSQYQQQQVPQQQQQYQHTPPSSQQHQAPQQQQQYQAPAQQQQQFQAPPQQQFQTPQQQQQFQAPPQQQQQFQQPAQQQYQQHEGSHGHPQQQRVLHSDNIKEERDHIKDHLEVPLDTSGMSEEELQYHYFKMHDADNNNRLDGQELIKSLFHWHDSANHHEATKAGHVPPPTPKIFTDEELISMIDPIMDQDDGNRDGYIDYPEFVTAQRKAASAASGANPNTQ